MGNAKLWCITYLDFRTEGVGVAFQNGFHCRLADGLIVIVVAAIDAVAALTVTPRGKALTVPAGRLITG